MHKVFILIYVLYSSTCFEYYYAHLQEDNCISTASGIVTLSLGDCSDQRLREDDTRCCTDTIVLKMSIIVLETCKCIKIKNLCINLVKKTTIILGCTVNKIYKKTNSYVIIKFFRLKNLYFSMF